MNAESLRAALRCSNPRCVCHRPRSQVHCPAHSDEHPSLSVNDTEDGRVLIHCFAGCAQEDLIEALRQRGLWDGRPPAPALSRLRDGRLEGPLNDAARFVERYVKMPSGHATNAVALWVAHCYVLDAFDVTPYLVVQSPEKRSGKTRLLEVLELLTPRAWLIVQPSEAVLFRKIAKDHPVLLLDEADAIFKSRNESTEPLRAVLNAGFRRGVTVPRCVGEGAKLRVVEFDVFCPKAIASIGRLPDTVQDRGIAVSLDRATPTEQRRIRRLRFKEAELEAKPVREALARWGEAALASLRAARPDLPAELDGRAADAWEPLFAVADQAGAGWFTVAWEAALALSTGAAREDDSLRIRLLADCRRVFDEREADWIVTVDLIEALCEDETAPWADFRGRRITPHALARLLRHFGVHPERRRDGDANARGYAREAFADTWTRYLPGPPPSSTAFEVEQVEQLNQDAGSSHFPKVEQTPPVPLSKNGANPVGTRIVPLVPLQTPMEGEVTQEEGAEEAPVVPGPTSPPAGPGAREAPDGPCYACRGTRFWRSVYGSVICATCHPPAVPALVAGWWVRRPAGQWLAIRPAHRTRGWKCVSPPEQVRAAVDDFYRRRPDRLPPPEG